MASSRPVLSIRCLPDTILRWRRQPPGTGQPGHSAPAYCSLHHQLRSAQMEGLAGSPGNKETAHGTSFTSTSYDHAVQLTPQQYKQLFESRKPCPLFRGVFGRFMRGTSEEDFLYLSAKAQKLSFICDESLLQTLCGLSGAETMKAIGKSKDWLLSKRREGATHRLFLFPPDEEVVLATWGNLLSLVGSQYGTEVHRRLEPHLEALSQTPYCHIDPALQLERLGCLPAGEKASHPDYMTPERLLAQPASEVTLRHARAFFFHSLGCNRYFTGTGIGPDGLPEYVMVNRLVGDIPGLISVDVGVSEEEIHRAYGTNQQ